MYAEGPEPAIMPASLSCERDDNQKGLPRRLSVPRANGPAVEASAPRPAGPQGDDAALSRWLTP